MPFYVLVIPNDQDEKLGDVRTKQWTPKEIAALNVGYVRLELLPRGVGKLLVRAPQLFYSIKPSEAVAANLEVVNEGTRRMDNVAIEVDPPLNWSKQIEPSLIQSLDIAEEKRIELKFTPPADVSAGRYEFRIRTTALSEDKPITGEDKTVTVEVQSEANIWGMAFIITSILAVVVGIVIFGIRLSRR
jgi:uncharacterized membrane protein